MQPNRSSIYKFYHIKHRHLSVKKQIMFKPLKEENEKIKVANSKMMPHFMCDKNKNIGIYKMWINKNLKIINLIAALSFICLFIVFTLFFSFCQWLGYNNTYGSCWPSILSGSKEQGQQPKMFAQGSLSTHYCGLYGCR